MANKFAGFKPDTLTKKILPALGYDGPTDEKSINKFLAASPAAAAKMGKYTMAAMQMVEGKPVHGAFLGALFGGPAFGTQEYKDLTAKTHEAAVARNNSGGNQFGTSASDPLHTIPVADRGKAAAERLGQDIFGRPADNSNSQQVNAMNAQKASMTQGTTQTTTDNTDGPQNEFTSLTADTAKPNVLTGSQATSQIQTDPTKPVTTANVQANQGDSTGIAEGTGQLGAVQQAQQTVADSGQQVDMPDSLQAQTMDASQSAASVGDAARQAQAAQGNVSQQALIDPAQQDPMQASALNLDAAQLGQAQTVDAPADLQVTPEQMIDGSAVDQKQVEETLALSKAASVQDELGDLMQDFEGGDTPPWAAGAMRAANAAMAARGLSSSSMAGMAVVQAAMESALPIAQMDAANKQQMAMAKAEQRAKFMGQEFDQNFQTKVKNAARISEIANINFSADQQVALENARMAQSVDLANLNNRQAKVMSDAATLSQMDMANLNNRQQAQVQNAKTFLQMDMANLDNEQMNAMFQSQSIVNSLFTDTAANNASKQFNATSQMQTDQYFANLANTASQFNTEQMNGMARFNAGEANALGQYNTGLQNARDQFNANNHLVIAQANAQWAQSITTADNAANNQANRDAAMASNNLTRAAYDAVIQQERDIMGWAWRSAESAADRDNAVATAKISADGKGADAFESGLGSFVGKLTDRAMDSIFS